MDPSDSSPLDKYTIFKKTDLYLDYSSSKFDNLTLISASITSIDLQLTNKEVKELKNFLDNLQRYHDQIALEVLRELQQIQMMNYQIQQFDQQFNRMQQYHMEEDSFDGPLIK
jgi:hypothetical protein